MHLYTLVFIYSYIAFYIHISLYHLYIISFMRFYKDLAIHVLSIFLSCMLLLIHILFPITYSVIPLLCLSFVYMCSFLVTSYILLTYIFMYFIRLSYLMTYTYTFLYLYVLLVLYQTVLFPIGVQNLDFVFNTLRYPSCPNYLPFYHFLFRYTHINIRLLEPEIKNERDSVQYIPEGTVWYRTETCLTT